jgi:hypothetical protein
MIPRKYQNVLIAVLAATILVAIVVELGNIHSVKEGFGGGEEDSARIAKQCTADAAGTGQYVPYIEGLCYQNHQEGQGDHKKFIDSVIAASQSRPVVSSLKQQRASFTAMLAVSIAIRNRRGQPWGPLEKGSQDIIDVIKAIDLAQGGGSVAGVDSMSAPPMPGGGSSGGGMSFMGNDNKEGDDEESSRSFMSGGKKEGDKEEKSKSIFSSFS